jgi:phosphate starvation-inducible protein PhoH and related proteins
MTKQVQESQTAVKKLPRLKVENLQRFDPLSDNQSQAFHAYHKGNNLILSGSAGTGKTFIAMYLAMREIMDKDSPYKKIVIIRSIVPTRDIGFLPGDEEEKKQAYMLPYIEICQELFNDKQAFEKLQDNGQIDFLSTSFIRGTTLNNAVIILDEMQNCVFRELDTVITRVGNRARFIMCGDYYQSDFDKKTDKEGILNFLKIVDSMNSFRHIEFTWADIVRSDFVRDYIVTKESLKIS